MVLDPIKHVLQVFLTDFKNIPGKACVKRVHDNDAFVTLEISVREKHKTPHTDKEEVLSGFITTARVVLSTIR